MPELAEKSEATNVQRPPNPAACGPDKAIEAVAPDTPVVGKRKQRLLQTVATIAMLAERYPKTFFVLGVQRKPLKIGIADDIVADGTIQSKDLRWALGAYCNSPDYLRSFQAGAARLDLNGNEAGIVTADEAEHAQWKLAAVLAKRQPKPKPAAPDKRGRNAAPSPPQAASAGHKAVSQPRETIILARPSDAARHRETGVRERQPETKASAEMPKTLAPAPTTPARIGFAALRAAAARRREAAGGA